MRKTSWAMLVMAGLLAIPAADAATIDAREHRQRERIREGVRSDELTRHEAARLRREQSRIRRDLQRDLSRSSRHIGRQKHDRQDR